MPVYRTPDGRIVEEKTDVGPPSSKAKNDTADNPDKGTVRREEGAVAKSSTRGSGRYTDTTVVRQPGGGTDDAGTESRRESDGRTRLVGAIPASARSETDETDPVSGWLVIMEGPGKGRDVRIGTGRNDLGRGPDNRIPLPFGDTRISRKAHLWITYDHLQLAFSVAPGEKSANLAHLDGVAIDTRLPLKDGGTLTIGRTVLRFVAFCGHSFNWTDVG